MQFLDEIMMISNIVKQYHNFDLNLKLFDLMNQALELLNENTRLTAENEHLKKSRNIEEKVVRHSNPYITLLDDDQNICYCATCWGNKQKLIQLNCYEPCDRYDVYSFKCPDCGTNGILEQTVYDDASTESYDLFDELNN